jgi:hypothetical protein
VTVAAMALDRLEGRSTTAMQLLAAASHESPPEPIALEISAA